MRTLWAIILFILVINFDEIFTKPRSTKKPSSGGSKSDTTLKTTEELKNELIAGGYVLAKMKGSIPWPAKILRAIETGKSEFAVVQFYASNDQTARIGFPKLTQLHAAKSMIRKYYNHHIKFTAAMDEMLEEVGVGLDEILLLSEDSNVTNPNDEYEGYDTDVELEATTEVSNKQIKKAEENDSYEHAVKLYQPSEDQDSEDTAILMFLIVMTIYAAGMIYW